MKSISLGKYMYGNSLIHKLDARVKIICFTSLFFIIFFSQTYFSVFLLLAYAMFLIYKSKILIAKYLKSTKSVIIITLFTAFLNLFFELETSFLSAGHISIKPIIIKNSILVFFRLFIITIVSTVLMFTTSLQDFSFALESILSPLRYIKMNPQEISLTITIALRFIPILFDETNKIILAQKARGANFNHKNIFKKIKSYSSVFIPVLIASFKKSEDLAVSMECRCYDSSKKRTRFKTLKVNKMDIIFLTSTLLFLLGVILCGNLVNI